MTDLRGRMTEDLQLRGYKKRRKLSRRHVGGTPAPPHRTYFDIVLSTRRRRIPPQVGNLRSHVGVVDLRAQRQPRREAENPVFVLSIG